MGKYNPNPYCDKAIREQLEKISKRVRTKDRDFVAVYDGEEGVGKSVLAQQHAKILDPDFCLDNIVFNSDDFIKKIKDPNTKKGTCIILDEAFSSANSRASLSQVNRSLVGLATEMRQKNLFVLLVLPSFFDLDRYFAIWRCRALFHVYFSEDEDRRYVVFDKDAKKLLYLTGKKTYSYRYPKATFAPSVFHDEYTVDETEYRAKKAEAFKKRTVSNQAKNWLLQRNFLIKYLMGKGILTQTGLNQLLIDNNIQPLGQQAISFIIKEMAGEGDAGEAEIAEKENKND